MTGAACPVLGGVIPACYLVTIMFFVLVFMGFKPHSLIWVGMLLAGLAFSGIASTSNIFQIAQCPVTQSGVPMCYLAFSLFTTLSVLFVIIQISKSKS